MDSVNLKILIAGEGGQGVQTIGKIIALAAFRQNLKSLYIPNFGVEQRGGVSIAFVQISDQKLSYPKFEKAGLLVLLNERSVKRASNYIDSQTKIITNSSLISKNQLHPHTPALEIDATNIANKEFTSQVLNMIILGALIPLLPLKKEIIKKTILDQLASKSKKNPALAKLNYRALEKGIKLGNAK